MLWCLKKHNLFCSLLASLCSLLVLVKAGFSDQEGEYTFKVLWLEDSCHSQNDFWHADSIHSIIRNQTHLHFLVFIDVIFTRFQAQLFDYAPLTVVEVDQVVQELRRVHELHQFNRTRSSPDC